MKFLDVLCAILVIIGGINWGIIGIANFNIIGFLFSDMYIDRVIYVLVGLAAVYQIFTFQGIQKRWQK